MIRNCLGVIFFLILAMLAAPRAAHAAEGYDNCAGYITSVPAVISTPGIWCLKQNLSTAITGGNAIRIYADDVTIDCNDFKLDGLPAGVGTPEGADTRAIGIYAIDRLNVTVRHCNIRGFRNGLFFDELAGNSGLVIEDNRFDGNAGFGIYVFGTGSVIRRNRVFDIGGSTQSASAIGIVASGSVDILDNIVSRVVARSGSNGNAIGIQTFYGGIRTISGNSVSGLVKDGSGTAYGIYNFRTLRINLRNNDLAGDGSASSVGIYCDNLGSGDGQIYGSAKDNVIKGFATALSCLDSGGNSVAP